VEQLTFCCIAGGAARHTLDAMVRPTVGQVDRRHRLPVKHSSAHETNVMLSKDGRESQVVDGVTSARPTYTERMTSLSVVIPATDGRTTLPRALEAVRAATTPPEEVIVIEEPLLLSPARARNLGARQATGDVVVFVDADVEVHRDTFSRIRRAFEEDDELVAVFGSYDDDPERHGLVSDFRNLLHHHVHHESAGPASTFWTGLGAIRRDAFLASGGFEPRFTSASLEDVELGMRLARAGRRLLLDPNIQGKHLKRWTLTSMMGTDLVRRGIPWVRLLLMNDMRSTALNLGWRHRVSAGTSGVMLVALLARRPRVAAGAAIVLVSLNQSFYRLLVRKRGWRQGAVAIPLHVLHHLVGIVAVPAGVVLHLRDRDSRSDS
jgi:hypothetical protein